MPNQMFYIGCVEVDGRFIANPASIRTSYEAPEEYKHHVSLLMAASDREGHAIIPGIGEVYASRYFYLPELS